MRLLIATFLLLGTTLSAQTTIGLIAHYRFNGNLEDATMNTSNAGFSDGMSIFECGVEGSSLLLNGLDSQVEYDGDVEEEFDTEDFTLSFYFKSTGLSGTQYLMSKQDTMCAQEQFFSIRYVPATRSMNVLLSENPGKSVSIITKLEENICWQHVTLVRRGNRVRLYINAEFVQELGTNSRINIDNNSPILLGNSFCKSQNETPFEGLIDELRVYNRALEEIEIRELFIGPDKIITEVEDIFLGTSVDIVLGSTCGTEFIWNPPTDIDNPFIAEPTITPTQSGEQVYTLQISDNRSSCVAIDSIRLNVIDPNNLDCTEAFVPKAFTPNGDGLNDIYAISNPFAIQNLISFEIFDRWGGRVFVTDNPFVGWDGSFKGEPVNPGVMLYKIIYLCEGEEQSSVGSLTIIR